jgi:hypothetical protein
MKKELPVPIQWEDGWAPEPNMEVLVKKTIFSLSGNGIPGR